MLFTCVESPQALLLQCAVERPDLGVHISAPGVPQAKDSEQVEISCLIWANQGFHNFQSGHWLVGCQAAACIHPGPRERIPQSLRTLIPAHFHLPFNTGRAHLYVVWLRKILLLSK